MKDEKKFHEQSLKEFENSYSLAEDERILALEDRRFCFVSGATWEAEWLNAQFENKPKPEINKVLRSVLRINNEYRNNRISTEFLPRKEEDEAFAEKVNDLFRADEQECNAERVYDSSFLDGISGGHGAWRWRNVYDENDEENELQRLEIETIHDADQRVFYNVGAKEDDKSDATWCWVLTPMTKDEYEEKYSDHPDNWPTPDNTGFDWDAGEFVWVSETYHVESENKNILIYKTVSGEEEKYEEADFEENLAEILEAVGTKFERKRTIKKKRIHKFIESGGGILEDEGYIAGSLIPVVPFYGIRIVIENIERIMGHVRQAKDAQRIKNVQVSKLEEISAYSPVEKPMLPSEMVAGWEEYWRNDNVDNYPYLPINTLMDKDGNKIVPQVQYTHSPNIPPAMAALLQYTEQDIKDILGDQTANTKVASNISAEAVSQIREELDMDAYIYLSNFAKAKKRSGQVWLSMAKEVYVEDNRMMMTYDKQDKRGTTKINIPDNLGGYNYDIAKASMSVSVDVGPATSTKKERTVRSLIDIRNTETDPTDRKIMNASIMMNMDGEGLSGIRKYYRKQLINMGVEEPSDEEAEEMKQEAQNQQPNPQDIYLQAAAKNEEAKATKAQAETGLTMAKAEETKAKIAEMLADMDRKDREQLLKEAEAIVDKIQ